MNGRLILLLFLLALNLNLQAQTKFMTRTGHISFFSTTSAENIEAHNRQVNSIIDLAKGEFVFAVLMKSFEFKKALMQEHFNENYIESTKFPKATFKGTILNLKEIDFTKNSTFKAIVEGDLTLHGVTKKIKSEGQLVKNGNNIEAKSTFNIILQDFNIEIPPAVKNNIQKQISISIELTLTPIK